MLLSLFKVKYLLDISLIFIFAQILMNARKVHSTAEKVQGVKIMWEAIPVFLSVCLVSNITEFCVPVWVSCLLLSESIV